MVEEVGCCTHISEDFYLTLLWGSKRGQFRLYLGRCLVIAPLCHTWVDLGTLRKRWVRSHTHVLREIRVWNASTNRCTHCTWCEAGTPVQDLCNELSVWTSSELFELEFDDSMFFLDFKIHRKFTTAQFTAKNIKTPLDEFLILLDYF
jgi:hypothetical protein